MLINSLVVYFHPHAPFEASSYKITFGPRTLREEMETLMQSFRYHVDSSKL